MKGSLIIAHRGASAYAPENTIASFLKAIEMNSDGIELDVHMTKDKALVVCHDETVNRTTNGDGFIKDHTLQEIKELDAGSWFGEQFRGEKIPVLEEVMDLIKDKDMLLNIELKNAPILYEGIEKRVIDIIKSYNMEERVIISSFNHFSLIEVKKYNPKIKTGVLYMAGLVEPWVYAKRLKADALHPLFYNLMIPEIVKGCQENGIMLNPFTVDDDKFIAAMIKLNVNGIITNYPDRGIKIRDNIIGGV
ncbi:glycerophosphoryl diester phosphodiesterase [Proteiniborus ethanoligenes]|uniref:Glycerophosphoryl diester phosphodiesterase n=1 Tax=Proteiniborus ethanoligenes TaxID=415015 RepID=A0A1H3L9X4_9FIRM|nr:glycerophosphodiester phosphodiesterase [Proteiniborus ethanoligenes]TAH63524.1 MAG: glycerophosphodiester phosphodiesterase [Gottschalkiaceae bacterium]SDY61327.1 glycerophosphoryl diester phosphodiesterase [Proteiniborus ethanoligenes]